MRKSWISGMVGYGLLVLGGCRPAAERVHQQISVFRDITLIDGTGSVPREHVDMVVQGDSIAAIVETGKDTIAPDAAVLDGRGETLMPELICCHGRLGLIKGTTMSPANDTTAGFGFGVPTGAPPSGIGMDRVYRPVTAEEAIQDVQELAPLHPDIIKLWLNDFGGKMVKMEPGVYAAIIKEAHHQGIRVAAHVYYLADARRLVADGIDILAHSVRDSLIDGQLLAAMKVGRVTYIPTLSLDEFQFVYADHPDWINDSFFKQSLEPGVWDTLTSKAYIDRLRKDPSLGVKRKAFGTALLNVKRVYDAGIPVVLGTDSGAQPVRAQGFSEHHELELLVKAGLTPLEAIAVATGNGARLLRISEQTGTLEPGKRADFMVLSKNPAIDIKGTASILSVWQNGVRLVE